MPTNPRVDAYIAKAKPFAQPILEHLRELVHRTVPEVDEAIKCGEENVNKIVSALGQLVDILNSSRGVDNAVANAGMPMEGRADLT